MQEQVVVWDIHHMWNGPPWYWGWYLIYLLVLSISAIVMGIRFWFSIGRHAARVKQCLDKVCTSLGGGDSQPDTSPLEPLPQRQPEAGIRRWADLPEGASQTDYLRVLSLADSEFRHEASYLGRSSRTLATFIGFTLFLFFYIVAVDVHPVIDWFLEKETGPRRFFVWAHETYGILGVTMWVSLVLFVVHRYMTGHPSRRCTEWDYFYTRAKTLLTLGSQDTSAEAEASKSVGGRGG